MKPTEENMQLWKDTTISNNNIQEKMAANARI